MITVLYRISSGEVLKISPKGQMFDKMNSDLFGYLIDPEFPNGKNNRAILERKFGPARQVGYQKIAIPEDNIVRNATKKEIESFDSFKKEDEKMTDALGAIELMDKHPRFRKVFKAISKSIEELEERIHVLESQSNPSTSMMLGTPEKGNIHKKIKGLINKDD